MLHQTLHRAPHVIVVGNEKGGSGKTTIAMHIAIALLKSGQRVGTLDLDSHQKSSNSLCRKSTRLGELSAHRT